MRSTKRRTTFREKTTNKTRSIKRKTRLDEKTIDEREPKRRRMTINNEIVEMEENELSLSKAYLITSRGPEQLNEIKIHNWNMW